MSNSINKYSESTQESLNYEIKILSNENRELRKLLENEIADKLSTSQALRYQHAKESALINSVPWLVFWVSSELFYLDANKFFTELLNTKLNSIIDKKVGTMNEDKELADSLLSFNNSTDTTRVEEIKIKHQSSYLYYLCIMHKNENLGHFSVVGIDISERKTINKLLNIKTKDLENILYVSSHDLKSPIQSITNLIKWLEEDLEDKLNNETKKLFSLMKNRITRMDNMLNSLLTYHSIEQKIYTISKFDIKKEITLLFNKHSQGHKQRELVFLSNAPIIETAGEALIYIFDVLISNSFKHNPLNKIIVEVLIEIQQDNYCFTFRDNGSGIPAEFQDKILEAFQTLKTKDEVEGCGMGLTIAKKIIERYHGIITINPIYDSGAEISFFWPIAPKI